MIETPILQFNFFGILSDVNAFLVFVILGGGIIGSISRKLSISAMGSILVFSHIVIETDLFIFDALLYLILIIVLLWASSFVVSSYFEGSKEVT